MTPDNNPTNISIAQLRTTLNGSVITPDDAIYDEARTVFYGGFDRRPALIVRVADAADVSHVVALARESGLELAVRPPLTFAVPDTHDIQFPNYEKEGLPSCPS